LLGRWGIPFRAFVVKAEGVLPSQAFWRRITDPVPDFGSIAETEQTVDETPRSDFDISALRRFCDFEFQ
jgi:hypothetical protein